MLKVQENISFKKNTTFQIGGEAKFFVVVKTDDDLREASSFAKSRKLPIFILGGGSNLLVSDNGFPGLVIKNEITGVKFVDQNPDQVRVVVGAGETLDDLLSLCVIRNFSGLENLSGIPGTVGGAVVQNAGAYGVEISDQILSVGGVNLLTGGSFSFRKLDCQFGYRDSFFKKNKKFFITTVTLNLNKKHQYNLDYKGLKDKLPQVGEIALAQVREAVINIRKEKLPDWHKLGTAGSFFTNPIISETKYKELNEKFPNLPFFILPNGKVKIPLAWILDNICHLKGYQVEKVGLYERQPLVVVNLGGATFKEVEILSEEVKNFVKEKTGIEIEEEVEKIFFK